MADSKIIPKKGKSCSERYVFAFIVFFIKFDLFFPGAREELLKFEIPKFCPWDFWIKFQELWNFVFIHRLLITWTTQILSFNHKQNIPWIIRKIRNSIFGTSNSRTFQTTSTITICTSKWSSWRRLFIPLTRLLIRPRNSKKYRY